MQSTAGRWRRAGWLLGGLVLGNCAAGLESSGASVRQTRTAPAAVPDWTGIWVIKDSFMDKQDGTSVAAPGRNDADDDLTHPRPPLKGRYLQAATLAEQADAAGKPIGDRGARCLPQGMP